MTLLESGILGLVQGVTEFLPVSSSGHLVVAERALGLHTEGGGVFFEVVLHVGSLVAVLAIFGPDLWRILRQSLRGLGLLLQGKAREAVAETEARLGIFILVATLPTGLIGLLFKDRFEALFGNLMAVGGAFLLTGTLLFLSEWRGRGARGEARGPSTMRWWDALVIGTAQGIAITPGISRSGSTIAAALFLGLDRKLAARFSFLLSVPAILGALVLNLRHGLSGLHEAPAVLLVGFLSAAISGYLALRLLLKLVDQGRFGLFAYYLWPLGLAVLAVALWR